MPPKAKNSYMWPQFLPDGNHFLFFVQTEATETSGVYAGALDSKEYRLLFPSETNALYSGLLGGQEQKNGYLLFIANRKLMGQAFSPAHLAVTGEPATLASDIGQRFLVNTPLEWAISSDIMVVTNWTEKLKD